AARKTGRPKVREDASSHLGRIMRGTDDGNGMRVEERREGQERHGRVRPWASSLPPLTRYRDAPRRPAQSASTLWPPPARVRYGRRRRDAPALNFPARRTVSSRLTVMAPIGFLLFLFLP